MRGGRLNFIKDKWKMLGHPDIVVWSKHEFHKVVYIEVKCPGATLSPEQKKVKALFDERHIPFIIAHSEDEAVEGLKLLGVIK